MKLFVAAIATASLLTSCSGPPIEEGLFFPTWEAEGAVPTAIVQGTLVEDNRCLFVETGNMRTLVIWEEGMGFEDSTLLDTSGSPIAHIGEMIGGGGGYFGDRDHIEQLSGESIPDRCVPEGANGDSFAIIYQASAVPSAS